MELTVTCSLAVFYVRLFRAGMTSEDENDVTTDSSFPYENSSDDAASTSDESFKV